MLSLFVSCMMVFAAATMRMVVAPKHAMRDTMSNQIHFATVCMRYHIFCQGGTFMVMYRAVHANNAFDPVGKSHQIVRYNNDSHRLAEFIQHLVQIILTGSIDVIGRFVQKENPWVAYQGTGNKDALAFPTA